jgi:uncharacterized protein (TIGR00730 family)
MHAVPQKGNAMSFERYCLLARTFAGLVHTSIQVLYGTWRITRLQRPIISIFGGAQMNPHDAYSHKAHDLANKLVDAGISIMTGGGPGIMQAASCGAIRKTRSLTSIGIGVTEIDEGKNPCVQEYFELSNFASRKFLLTHFSIAFIIFPGGFGTLDELAEILTLIKTKKLPPVPIVLIGKEYWKYFMQWLREESLIHGLITREDFTLFTLTDDLQEAFNLVCQLCKKKNNTNT